MISLNSLLKGRACSIYSSAAKNLSLARMSSSTAVSKYSYETLLVSEPSEAVYHVELNRPHKANSLSMDVWREIRLCFDELSLDPNCRVIVFSGKGKHFTAGIDLPSLAEVGGIAMGDDDIARKCRQLKDLVAKFQASFTSLEKCYKPVICAIHNACIGAGVGLICGADIRLCTSDAFFQIKEVDLGIGADVGTLQRLPKIVGNESLVRELAFTGRKFTAEEALRFGFVSAMYPDNSILMKNALELASVIAEKSPVAVQASKEALIHARDHTVEDSLNFQATVNMSFLQSEDVQKAVMAQAQKEKVKFSKL